jgi:hypothetical protein
MTKPTEKPLSEMTPINSMAEMLGVVRKHIEEKQLPADATLDLLAHIVIAFMDAKVGKTDTLVVCVNETLKLLDFQVEVRVMPVAVTEEHSSGKPN